MKNVKWWVFIVILSVIGKVIADEYKPYSVPVGTNSTVVLPNLKPTSVTTYTLGATYTQGTYLSVPANPGTYYWVVSPAWGGTNVGVLLTNYATDVNITDGDIVIRSVPKTRNWYRIGNISTSIVYGAEGKTAVASAGIVVRTAEDYEADRGTDLDDKCYQGEVNFISGTGTNETLAVFVK